MTGDGNVRENKLLIYLAGGRGFEPRLTESESAVLPLDDPPSMMNYHSHPWRSACAAGCTSLVVLGESFAGKLIR